MNQKALSQLRVSVHNVVKSAEAILKAARQTERLVQGPFTAKQYAKANAIDIATARMRLKAMVARGELVVTSTVQTSGKGRPSFIYEVV